MIINYNVDKISSVLHDFYNATGIDMDLLKPDFTSACNYTMKNLSYCEAVQSTGIGKKACKLSDERLLTKCSETKKTEMCICHAGLLNVAIPLLYDDIIIGYIIFGRMKPDTDFSRLYDYIKKLGLPQDVMREYYSEIHTMEKDRLQSLSNIAIMLGKYILLKNMLKPNLNENLKKAIDYIDSNLENDLSIKLISKNVNMSKSVLYKHFHSNFNCTVSDYINAKRIERSIELMKNDTLSIEEISRRSGFSSAAYYSKIFKKQMGLPPIKYRKRER